MPNHWRVVRAGIVTMTEVVEVCSLDDIDLWNLYLDAIDEAMIPPDRIDP